MPAIGYKSRIVSCSAYLPLNESATRFIPGQDLRTSAASGGVPLSSQN
jgi:hypothetical protein